MTSQYSKWYAGPRGGSPVVQIVAGARTGVQLHVPGVDIWDEITQALDPPTPLFDSVGAILLTGMAAPVLTAIRADLGLFFAVNSAQAPPLYALPAPSELLPVILPKLGIRWQIGSDFGELGLPALTGQPVELATPIDFSDPSAQLLIATDPGTITPIFDPADAVTVTAVLTLVTRWVEG